MRSVDLAFAAADAEKLRLKLHVRRIVVRVVLGVVAGIWLLAAFAWLHVAVWLWLAPHWGGMVTAFAWLGLDLAIALVLLILASRSAPSAVEVEAAKIRADAWRELLRALTFAALFRPVMGMAVGALMRRRRSPR